MRIKLENRQIGVFAALILAAVMFFLPGQDRKRYAFNPDAIAGTISESREHVAPGDLSQWLLQGKNDFTLVDIRSTEEYAQGHIRGAKNIPLAVLLKRSTMEREFIDGKTVVLYSNGTSHAAQAWLVLKTAGVDCSVLEGGYNYWVEAILKPAEPPAGAADDEILKYRAAQSVADHFGGAAQQKDAVDGGKKGAKTPGAPMKRSGKKKLQGC